MPIREQRQIIASSTVKICIFVISFKSATNKVVTFRTSGKVQHIYAHAWIIRDKNNTVHVVVLDRACQRVRARDQACFAISRDDGVPSARPGA